VAFALRSDGWFLRKDIVWHKPNPIPESVHDRPTCAHEYVFLLSKSPRYYYDIDATRVPVKAASITRWARQKKAHPVQDQGHPLGRRHSMKPDKLIHPLGRNRRSVWTIPPEPYRGPHFAAFPKELVRPCVRAGAPEGGLVLDPFAGTGTVGIVCKEEGRRFLGIELNSSYINMARERMAA
jgi:DNA modification methylase